MWDNDILKTEMLSQLQVDTEEKAITAVGVVVDKARIEQETRLRELEMNERNNGAISSEFHLSKQVRLVPKFREAQVDVYFKHFEKTEKWPTLRCQLTVVKNTRQ